jgi:hypothetical protein
MKTRTPRRFALLVGDEVELHQCSIFGNKKRVASISFRDNGFTLLTRSMKMFYAKERLSHIEFVEEHQSVRLVMQLTVNPNKASTPKLLLSNFFAAVRNLPDWIMWRAFRLVMLDSFQYDDCLVNEVLLNPEKIPAFGAKLHLLGYSIVTQQV